MIVCLTLLEVSVTLWAVFEISKGAKLHQLNLLHLKYSIQFSNQAYLYRNGQPVSLMEMRETLGNIKQQPIDCLDQVNALSRFVMSSIGTDYAIELCKKDIKDIEVVARLIDNYENKEMDRDEFTQGLVAGAQVFTINSELFEAPITKTVEFVISIMIPLVIFISLVNIFLIVWLSKKITGSISSVISMLRNPESNVLTDNELDSSVSGEMSTLLIAAKQRVEANIKQRQANQTLEELVQERTNSLQQAHQELANFAYSSSHDLKGPLTSTKNLTKFIIEDIQSGKHHEAIDNSKKVLYLMESMQHLVTGILAVTDVNNEKLSSQSIDFAKLFSQVENHVANQAVLKHCAVTFDVQIDSTFYSDPKYIAAAIEQLVDNGIRYSDPAEAYKWVNVEAIEHENQFIVTVQDNGIGIPEEKQDEVFLMFKRFAPDVASGSGLGLATVCKIVSKLGGEINFTSSEKGTKFILHFVKGKTVG